MCETEAEGWGGTVSADVCFDQQRSQPIQAKGQLKNRRVEQSPSLLRLRAFSHELVMENCTRLTLLPTNSFVLTS